jgi:hypothetical protein
MASRLTVKVEPVKKVETAAPRRIGASRPLMKRKV